jgi:hypothetical protein
MGVGGQRHALAAFTPWKDPVPIVHEGGWAPGPVWTGAENLAPNGIRSPDRPARSESLYRLSYPGPHKTARYKQIVQPVGIVTRLRMDDRGSGFRFPTNRRDFYFSEASPDRGDIQPASYSMGPESSFSRIQTVWSRN